MSKTAVASVILTALFGIKHNGIAYRKGETFAVSDSDAHFLRMGGCVREPTAEELERFDTTPLNPPLKSGEDIANPPPATKSNTFATDTSKIKTLANNISIGTELVVDNQHGEDSLGVPEQPTSLVQGVTPSEAVLGETDASITDSVDTEAEANEVAEADELTAETETADSTVDTINPYANWLKKDLNAELDKRGIEHDERATNDELEALLVADDANKADA